MGIPNENDGQENLNDKTKPHSYISRRNFLHGIGAAAVAAVASQIVMPSSVIAAVKTTSDNMEAAKKLASHSKLYELALAELKEKGFAFDLEKSEYLQPSTEYAHIAGLALADLNPNPSSTVSNIMITIDLEKFIITTLTYTIRVGSDNVLDITTVTFRDEERFEEHTQHDWNGSPTRVEPAHRPVSDSEVVRREERPNPKDSDKNSTTAGTLSCGLYYVEYTQWYEAGGCCGTTWCTCCGPWGLNCKLSLRCVCGNSYRNFRECYDDANCVKQCGPWYSEWRERQVGCSGNMGCYS